MDLSAKSHRTFVVLFAKVIGLLVVGFKKCKNHRKKFGVSHFNGKPDHLASSSKAAWYFLRILAATKSICKR
ncbi:MAG: hypothetical protein II813_01445 [Spirochaetales bacterium]|nr:hypothetical protein [Spirochaetales bacterium]